MGHNRLIITKIKDLEEAIFYCKATLQNGWNRDHLGMAIRDNYYLAKGKSITNFQETLPHPQSELAIETLKNPYNFESPVKAQAAFLLLLPTHPTP